MWIYIHTIVYIHIHTYTYNTHYSYVYILTYRSLAHYLHPSASMNAVTQSDVRNFIWESNFIEGRRRYDHMYIHICIHIFICMNSLSSCTYMFSVILRSPLQMKNNLPYNLQLHYDNVNVTMAEGNIHYVPLQNYSTFQNFRVGMIDDVNGTVTAWTDELSFNKHR